MIGVPVDWPKICRNCKIKDVGSAIRDMRQKGMTYKNISVELGVSTAVAWNKVMDLIEAGEFTQEEMRRNLGYVHSTKKTK
jgi:predicted DNA-binding transcriptional regulator